MLSFGVQLSSLDCFVRVQDRNMFQTFIKSFFVIISSTKIATSPFSSVVERSTCTLLCSNAEVIRSIRVGGNQFLVIFSCFWTLVGEAIIPAQKEHHVLHLEHVAHHGAKPGVVWMRIA